MKLKNVKFLFLSWVFVFLNFIPQFAAGKEIVPNFDLIKTVGGAEIYFFKSPKIPIFQIQLVFPGGCFQDPMNKSGTSQILGSLMSKGLPGLNEEQIHEKLDFMAATLGVSVDDDKTILSAVAMNDKVEPVLDLLFKMLTDATLPKDIFERIKSNHLDHFKQVEDYAPQMLERALHFIVFNKTKWARPCSGLKSEVEKISLQDILQQRKLLFLQKPQNLKILIIGGENQSIVVKHFISRLKEFEMKVFLKNSKKEASIKLEKPDWQLDSKKVLLLDRPGISEAYIGFSSLGPSRQIPEYYDLLVASQILGGSFKSRLNQILREKLGLTYSVQGGFSMDSEIGQFSVVTSAQASSTAAVYAEIEKILNDFSTGVFTDEEITLAIDYLTGSFPLSLSNVYSIASSFFQGIIDGYNPNFLNVYEQEIQKVTAVSLKHAIQKHFKMANLKTVVVGDATKIKKVLKQKIIQRKFDSFL